MEIRGSDETNRLYFPCHKLQHRRKLLNASGLRGWNDAGARQRKTQGDQDKRSSGEELRRFSRFANRKAAQRSPRNDSEDGMVIYLSEKEKLRSFSATPANQSQSGTNFFTAGDRSVVFDHRRGQGLALVPERQ